MEQEELLPHLFRTEFRKITAVLCKVFGAADIETAEDIASETFTSALETWPYKGMPENPVAWLYSVAKNKARNHIARHAVFSNKVSPYVSGQFSESSQPDIDLSSQNIRDSQLQMLFAICHPVIPPESQVGLALRILCGFGIEEIANAFLTNKETINKRLFRARQKLREENIPIAFPGDEEVDKRLQTVLRTIYLLYNEGYYSESQDALLREDLCLEAMRLAFMLIENEKTNQPTVNALFSLMCFHSSRFKARQNEHGEMILYNDQDESLWDQALIAQGVFHLKEASRGTEISKYHLEAGIAFWHTKKADTAEKWENILQLYNHLLQLEYSPVAALNRTFALSKVHSKQIAIVEAEKLKLINNRFYFSLLGELYMDIDSEKAKSFFDAALLLAKSKEDRKLISEKLQSLAGLRKSIDS
ncbi:sigma-70 family RNA polymerase sigma factor [Pedobacter sp. HMF7647]|uniref:Sigma-70 family RNA polymerase sigma factor n=1 Tax=Hufsiella arboris TaxID=2695275 RepID=A0A7K1Y5Q5_9SPHI|nr:sigma-70 family RNA polymerase sigma factor [Hufsiella arboris]MXV49916.1 sigma-70 family RNA polymerase sigma factor [Hufsiella arboris]